LEVEEGCWTVTYNVEHPAFEEQTVTVVAPEVTPFRMILVPEIAAEATEGLVLLGTESVPRVHEFTAAEIAVDCPAVIVTLF
jgi:hypothetical protein